MSEYRLVPQAAELLGDGEEANKKRRAQRRDFKMVAPYTVHAEVRTEADLDIYQEYEIGVATGQGIPRAVCSGSYRKWLIINRMRDNQITEFRNDATDALAPNVSENVRIAACQRNRDRGPELTELATHANILSVVCFLSANGDDIDGVAMDAGVEGTRGTVEHYMENTINNRGSVTDEIVLRWCYQLASALRFLHSDPNYILHRAINPAHVYVFGRNGETVKLGDFFYGRKVAKNVTANVNDRLTFAAPEVLSTGPYCVYSFSSDIWSLGMLLYFACHNSSLPLREPYNKRLTVNKQRFKEHLLEPKNKPVLRENLKPLLKDVIEACWREEKRDDEGNVGPLESLRPTAGQIVEALEMSISDLN